MSSGNFRQVCDDFLKQLSELDNDKDKANKLFKNFNKELNPINRDKKQKNTLKNEMCVRILEKFYEVTKLHKELNEIWGNYTNILKYNEINCRRKLIRLIESDCEKETIPPGVLGLFFSIKNDLAKFITKKEIVIQAICTVEDILTKSLEESKVIKDLEKFFSTEDGIFLKNLNNSSIMTEEERDDYFKEFCNKYKIRSDYLLEIYLIVENVDKFSQLFDVIKEDVEGNIIMDTSISGVDAPSDFISSSRYSNIKKLLRNFNNQKIKSSVFMDNVYKMCVEDRDNKGILLETMGRDKKGYPKELTTIINECDTFSYDDEISKEFDFMFRNETYPSSKKYYYNDSDFENVNVIDIVNGVKILEDEIEKSLESNQSETPFFFFDIKTTIKYNKEQLAYIALKRKNSFWIIDCHDTQKQVFVFDFLEKLFTNVNISIVMYNSKKTINKLSLFFKFAKEKMKKTISNIFSIYLIINSFVRKDSSDPEIKKIFPSTYKEVFVYNNEHESHENKIEKQEILGDLIDDGDSVMPQTIKNICKDLTFSQAVHLVLGKPYDECEDTEYSFWQRNPLREAQKSSMKMRLNALEEMFMKLRIIINEKMNVNYRKEYISRTEVFFNKYKVTTY